ncbi:hypothetical protein HGRIS_007145 [Hohenbuehelia grisea]|uniref:DUF2470 domain-containing protein n=1 Tax=Hohenbuehelia grisea TaxID=104357 RepID=A0ABR3JBH4_9AGAR
MADPVAEKSTFLRMYMTSHPDTLVAYAKWYGEVEEPITGTEMTAIDTKSMTLTCTLKNGTKRVANVRFEPPLAGYEDVKPRLLEMKAIAQENLGMIKAPQLKSFHFPRPLAKVILPVVLIDYLTAFTWFGRSYNSPAFDFTRQVFSYIGGDVTIYIVWLVMSAIQLGHALESLYTLHLCRSYRTGFPVGFAYVLSTVLFGFPIWLEMRRRVHKIRIDSVMKVE